MPRSQTTLESSIIIQPREKGILNEIIWFTLFCYWKKLKELQGHISGLIFEMFSTLFRKLFQLFGQV